MSKRNTADLKGMRFGILVAGRMERLERHTGWVCLCDCGKEKVIRGAHLRGGSVKSCGCGKAAMVSAAITKSGLFQGRKSFFEASSWQGAKDRCHNEASEVYYRYGGRGITMCDRWRLGEGGRTGFECFFLDMGPRPSPRHTLEREDNAGGYSPDNCKWATPKEQARNRRSNRIVNFRGESMCAEEAAERAGLNGRLVRLRLRRGWSVERALSVSP